MTTTESRLMRVEERQADLRVKVAGLEVASEAHSRWIEAHRQRASAAEQRLSAADLRLADHGSRLQWLSREIGELRSHLIWLGQEVRRIGTVPAKTVRRLELPVAFSILGAAVLARYLGIDPGMVIK